MNKAKIALISIAVIAVAVLLWTTRSHCPGSAAPAETAAPTAGEQAAVMPAPAAPESAAAPVATPAVQDDPWTPYVGRWTGEIVCHSSTYREGGVLNCSADLVINKDGSLTLSTLRRFPEDGAVHGTFTEEGRWPGRFDDRDGVVSFSGPGTGIVTCIWLSTVEQNVVIPLKKTAE